jgi:hypothetical protein
MASAVVKCRGFPRPFGLPSANSMSANSSFDSYLTPNIKCVTHDPSTDSRLGDIGYVAEGGRWRKIVNIVDGISCYYLGINAIKRTHELEDYIGKRKHTQFNVPFVTINEGGTFDILTPDHFDLSS